MTAYVALLRGINVGGYHRVKMSELKGLCESIGLQRVKTHIQSGNILFDAQETPDHLTRLMEDEMEAAFGFKVPTVLRTSLELAQTMTGCPFSPELVSQAQAASDMESLYVALLAEKLSDEQSHRLTAMQSDQEQMQVVGRDVYLLFWQGIRNSKLSVQLQKVAPRSTIRNWNTLTQLESLARRIEE